MSLRHWFSNAAMLLLSVLTWYSGDVKYRIDHCIAPAPVVVSQNLYGHWQVVQKDAHAQDAMMISEEGVQLELQSSLATEHTSTHTNKNSVNTLGSQSVLAQARYPVRLVPPFNNAALLAESTITRLSKPQIYIRQEAKPLFYMAARDDDALVDYLLIHRSLGFSGTQTVRVLNVNVPPSRMVELGWRLANPGIWRLDSVSLSWVALNPTYPKFVNLLWLAWAIVALTLLMFLIKRSSWMARIAMTGLVLLLLAGILAQQALLQKILLAMNQLLVILLPVNMASEAFFLQKAGHFIAFTALAFVALTQQKRLQLSTFNFLFFFLILAFATEAIQRHIPKRSASFEDMLIDMLGVLAGYLIFVVLKTLLSMRRLLK